MKIQILTKRLFLSVFLAAFGLFPLSGYTQVPIRPIVDENNISQPLPPILPQELPPIVSENLPPVVQKTLPPIIRKELPSILPDKLPPIVSDGGNQKGKVVEQAFSSRQKNSLPPVLPGLERTKAIKPLAPMSSSRKTEPAVIIAKRPEVQKIPKSSTGTSSRKLPAIQPWDGKGMMDLPKVTPKVTKVGVKKDISLTPASFANPAKPLPVITKSNKQGEFDTTNKMIISVPKSALRKTEPILVTKNPAGFSESTSSRTSSSRKLPPVSNWKPVPADTDLPALLPATNPVVVQPVASKSVVAEPEVSKARTASLVVESRESIAWNTKPIQPKANESVATKPLLSKQELKAQIEALLPKNKTSDAVIQSNRFVSNPYIQDQPVLERVVNTKVKPVAEPKPVMPQVPMSADHESEVVMETIGQTVYPRSPIAVLRGEALYVSRERGDVAFSNQFSMDPFDFELGFRLNAQRLFGVGGRSLTYTGIQEWNAVNRVGAAGGLGITSTAGTGLPAGVLTPFTGAIFQQQHHRANYHSLEWNNVTWGWDVLNLFWGVRVTHYEEEFNFFSARGDGQQGLLDMDVENFVIGPQVGGEVYYDIGKMFSTGVKFKLGAMATGVESETQLISNGVRRINNSDSDVKFNFLAEVGVFGRMRLGPRAYLRGGYEMWYNSSIYGINENIPGAITPAFGQTVLDDDMLIHGGTLGLEIHW